MFSKLIGPVLGKLEISTYLVRLNFGVVGQVKPLRSFSSNKGQQEWSARKQDQKYNWESAINEAERIVGCSTSFLSLPWILSDEFATFAPHLRKLAESNHPLLRTAKHIIYEGKNTLQLWNLVILLISKAAGHASDMEEDKSADIFHSQRVIAEIIEMMQISHRIHQSIVNLPLTMKTGENTALYDDLALGNKISVLCGDYLVSQAGKELANLNNLKLEELLYSAYRGLLESEFIGERDEESNPLPSKPPISKGNTNSVAFDKDLVQSDLQVSMDIENFMGVPEKEWEFRNIFGAGSLLGKGCQGALHLADQPEGIQRQGDLFGKHLALAWQAHLDAKPFQISILPIGETFSMISAPVLFHLEYDSSLYAEIEKGKTSVDNINYENIHSEVFHGPGLERTKNLQKKHAKAAMDVLETFPPSDAQTGLQNIIQAMQDL